MVNTVVKCTAGKLKDEEGRWEVVNRLVEAVQVVGVVARYVQLFERRGKMIDGMVKFRIGKFKNVQESWEVVNRMVEVGVT